MSESQPPRSDDRPARGPGGDRGDRSGEGRFGDRGDRGGEGRFGDRSGEGRFGDRGDRGGDGRFGDRGDRGGRGPRSDRPRAPMSVKGRLRAKARKKARKQAKAKGGLQRKKVSRLSQDKTLVVDYKDPKLLRLFLTETGKIIPRRISGNTAKQQREVTLAIKRARQLALLPYTGHHGG